MTAFINFFTDQPGLVVLLVYLLASAIQLLYYLGIYMRFVFYRRKTEPAVQEPVSVIICARNEADNLDQYLPALMTQDYPEYEVIVVNDCSTDDTDQVLKKHMAQYSGLRTTTIREDKKFSHGKKLAVTIGIKSAQHERLLFIDGDCRPESSQWLSRMASHFSDNTAIVLGYGGYLAQPGLLNKYIRYDTLVIALQYFSYALCGWPYMGVGRNLAYRRSLFYSGKGFSNHYHLASGDDDLFVNEHATKSNTAVEFSPESHTRTAPKESYDKWTFQKKRHFSTNKLYKPVHKFLLGLEPVSRLLFYAGFIAALILSVDKTLVISVFAFRMMVQLFVIKKSMMKLKEKDLLLISLFFDPVSMFINFGLLITSRIRPSNYQWK
jgi:poly-beta-1,6-N-acetyl-D-glucosamine synthase